LVSARPNGRCRIGCSTPVCRAPATFEQAVTAMSSYERRK
jgi:hypothetical protein